MQSKALDLEPDVHKAKFLKRLFASSESVSTTHKKLNKQIFNYSQVKKSKKGRILLKKV
jgi:hypothetical protein